MQILEWIMFLWTHLFELFVDKFNLILLQRIAIGQKVERGWRGLFFMMGFLQSKNEIIKIFCPRQQSLSQMSWKGIASSNWSSLRRNFVHWLTAMITQDKENTFFSSDISCSFGSENWSLFLFVLALSALVWKLYDALNPRSKNTSDLLFWFIITSKLVII